MSDAVPELGTLAAALLHVPESIRAEFEPERIFEYVGEDHCPHRLYVCRFTGRVNRHVVLSRLELQQFGVGAVDRWVEE